AQLQATHLVDVLATSGEHDDRHVRDLADGLQYLESVHTWHGHIEQDHVWLRLEEPLETGLTVGRGEDLGILPLELHANFECIAQACIVVYDENLHRITSSVCDSS